MKPLSVLYYLINNIKRIIPVVLSVSLGVMSFYFLYLAGAQANNLTYAAHVKPFEYFSIISSGNGITSDLISEIKEDKTIDRIIPLSRFPHTAVTAALGNSSIGILFIKIADISYLMEIMGLQLTEGIMPEAENEILLHWRIAANKKLAVGDVFTDNNEINSKFKIVGIFDGNSVIGFAPDVIEGNGIEDWADKGLLLLPEEGNIDRMNASLEKLPEEQGVRLELLDQLLQEIKESTRVLERVMLLLVSIVVFVLCITLSDTSIMHFHLRKNEFGLLTVIGYTRREIMKRIWTEEIMIYGLSYILGILLSILCAQTLNILLWNPMGENVPLWNQKGFFITMVIPVFVTAFSVRPTAKLLKIKDMIQIIEGR